MHFKKNTKVLTHDDQKVGHIERVVIDPATDEISHLVVEKGFLFTEDKVVPVTDIQSTGEKAVILKKTAAPEDYPAFDETQYIPNAGVEDFNRRQADEARQLLWYHAAVKAPFLKSSPYPSQYKPLYYKEKHRNIPEDAVALEEGADVTDRDGRHLGSIADVFTEPKTFNVSHFLVSSGLIKKDKKIIPAAWVKDMVEETVQLHIKKQVFENLPDADNTEP